MFLVALQFLLISAVWWVGGGILYYLDDVRTAIGDSPVKELGG